MKKSKTFFRNARLVTDILKLLKEGKNQKEIAEELRLSKELVHYYIKKCLQIGLITRLTRDLVEIYEVTTLGENFLTRSERVPRFGVVRLHHFGLEFRVTKLPSNLPDWRKVSLVNWCKYVGWEGGTTVEFVDGSEPKLIVWAQAVYSNNVEQARVDSVVACLRVAALVCRKYGMEVDDRPRVVGRPHYGVTTPAVRELAKYVLVSTDEGSMDESEGYGEMDLKDPELAQKHIGLPFRVEELEKQLNVIHQGSVTTAQLVKQMAEEVHYLTLILKSLFSSQPSGGGDISYVF